MTRLYGWSHSLSKGMMHVTLAVVMGWRGCYVVARSVVPTNYVVGALIACLMLNWFCDGFFYGVGWFTSALAKYLLEG